MANLIEYLENPKHIHQQNEALNLIKKFETDIDIQGGVLRWTMGNIVPADIADLAKHVGYPVDIDETNAAREEHQLAALAEYAENQKNRTVEQKREELFEMVAAFGTGTTVVNVFTGKRHVL